VYCYARPAHAYVDLSPGLDFESRLFAKPEAAALLRAELAKPGYRCSPIALGGNTDAYQPIERKLRITRGIVEVLAETKHPFTIVTKSALVERDLDLLAPMAELDLVRVFVSVTSLDRGLARRMEPRAAAPQRRLETIARLAAAGVPVGVMFAPIVPALNDHELESVLEAAAAAGARGAGYVVLRLPREVNGLFKDWLVQHYPLRAGRVMNRVRELRGGRENVTTFGERLQGSGIFAKLTAERFRKACARHGLDGNRGAPTTRHFTPPRANGPQLELF
jgi:DNA repair photolyase